MENPIERGFMTGWLVAGALVWAVATLAFRFIGQYLFENGLVLWAISIGLVIIGFVALFTILANHVLPTKPENRLDAAANFSFAGMLGEVPILLFFGSAMSNMQAETAGRYGAFLFLGYGALFAFVLLTRPRSRSH